MFELFSCCNIYTRIIDRLLICQIKRPVPSKPNQPITRAQTEYRCEESDILRDMIRTLMSAHNMSQSSVSQEFNRTHNLGIPVVYIAVLHWLTCMYLRYFTKYGIRVAGVSGEVPN